MTYSFALYGIYQVLHTLYNAYFALGFFTYVVALISYLPYMQSFIRMVWHDSETRRMIFYRNVLRFWMLTLAIDGWVFFNIVPETREGCQATAYEDSNNSEIK